MKLKGVDHLAFVVSDLERSVKFYQELFDGEVGRSRGFNEQDKAAKRSQHTLVKVGNFAFDLFQMAPGDPPRPIRVTFTLLSKLTLRTSIKSKNN
jgi:catechol 2,3-dioxygenase-like lactoylglutathione lyase family enzyme